MLLLASIGRMKVDQPRSHTDTRPIIDTSNTTCPCCVTAPANQLANKIGENIGGLMVLAISGGFTFSLMKANIQDLPEVMFLDSFRMFLTFAKVGLFDNNVLHAPVSLYGYVNGAVQSSPCYHLVFVTAFVHMWIRLCTVLLPFSGSVWYSSSSLGQCQFKHNHILDTWIIFAYLRDLLKHAFLMQ